jgi:hypothetical protein
MSPALRELDGQQLKSITNANHTSEVVMTHLACRQRNRSFSDVTRTRMLLLRNGEKIEEKDYLAFWKSLENAGVGTLVAGGGKRASQFRWKYSLKIIAESAINGRNLQAMELPSLPKKAPVAAKSVPAKPAQKVAKLLSIKSLNAKSQSRTEPARAAASTRSEKTVHVFLRPDFMVALSVPVDFSKDEAAQLCKSLNHMAQ